jgi:hypothetical protein
MEWLGVLLMLLVAILAAETCNGLVRLLYVVAPPIKAAGDEVERTSR